MFQVGNTEEINIWGAALEETMKGREIGEEESWLANWIV